MKRFKKPAAKSKAKIKAKPRRHIEDVPLYRLVYGFDDLPLDPARDFIQVQISKFLGNQKLLLTLPFIFSQMWSNN
jgi:hypothetical protein